MPDAKMLLRLLGLSVLSALCSTTKDIRDESHFYNDHNQDFEAQPELLRQRRSLENFTDMNGNTVAQPDMSVMFPDTSICDALLETQQLIAIDQIPFFCLCSHCKATTGPKGERGDRGLQGFAGSPGRRGLMGFQGRRGFTGAQGVKGQKGDQGDKGQPGHIGFPGMKGELGVKGEKGDHGNDGPAGPEGPQGVAGSCLCDTVMGPPGVQGSPGSAGARGLPGPAGSKGTAGAKGDKGNLGENGSDGAPGLKGEQGEQGMCDCTDGVNGADGQKGEKGDVGGKGDTGPNGDQGETGIPGPKGDPGMPGIPGPCSLAVQSAFCVGLETPFPMMNRPVRFTRIIYNVQSHYNPQMGLFIAPVNGTYSFSFHLAVKDKILVAGLFHNFYPVLVVTEATNLATSSQNVVLHLTERDIVWVQVKDDLSNGMFVDREISSTFSGFLLSPDTCFFGGYKSFTQIESDYPPDSFYGLFD